MKCDLSSLWSWAKRYLSAMTLVCIAVVAYIIFSGENNISQSIEYDRRIDSLKSCLEANRDTMLFYRQMNQRLSSDPDMMEQVVREQYGMKRAGEDVYIFYDSNNQ